MANRLRTTRSQMRRAINREQAPLGGPIQSLAGTFARCHEQVHSSSVFLLVAQDKINAIKMIAPYAASIQKAGI
jgi:hypothetical protein